MNDISKLNEFLTGVHMGISNFENHYLKTSDTHIKEVLKEVHTTYEGHENLISNRIESLGGKPHHGVGIIGGAAKVVEDLKERTIKTDDKLIEKAQSDLETAIKMSNKFLNHNPNLDEESTTLIRGIIKDNEKLLVKTNEL